MTKEFSNGRFICLDRRMFDLGLAVEAIVPVVKKLREEVYNEKEYDTKSLEIVTISKDLKLLEKLIPKLSNKGIIAEISGIYNRNKEKLNNLLKEKQNLEQIIENLNFEIAEYLEYAASFKYIDLEIVTKLLDRTKELCTEEEFLVTMLIIAINFSEEDDVKKKLFSMYADKEKNLIRKEILKKMISLNEEVLCEIIAEEN